MKYSFPLKVYDKMSWYGSDRLMYKISKLRMEALVGWFEKAGLLNGWGRELFVEGVNDQFALDETMFTSEGNKLMLRMYDAWISETDPLKPDPSFFKIQKVKLKKAKFSRIKIQSLLLRDILQKEWRKSCVGPFKTMRKALNDPSGFNEKLFNSGKKKLIQNQKRMAERVRAPGNAVLRLIANNSTKRFNEMMGGNRKVSLAKINAKNQWDDWFQSALTDHLEKFVEKYPERILFPQLGRKMKGEVDEKIDKLSLDNPYWENLSSIEASMAWHGTAIKAAHQEGIRAYQIVNGPDPCEVCQELDGVTFRVEHALELVERLAEIEDPEEYKEVAPFPRINDVLGLSDTELAASGFFLPPYHGYCQCEIHFLFYAKDDSYLEEHNVGRDEKGRFIRGVKPWSSPTGFERPKNANYFQYEDLPKFKNRAEAEAWIKKNLAEKVDFDDASLEEINTTLESLRAVTKHAPLKRRLVDFSWGDAYGNHGVFWPIGSDSDPDKIPMTGAIIMNPELETEKRDFVKRLRLSLKHKKEMVVEYERALKDIIEWYEKEKPSTFSYEDYQENLKATKRIISNFEGQIKEIEKRLKDKVKLPLPTFSFSALHKTQAGGTAIHEYGHAWHWQYRKEVKEFFGYGWYSKDNFFKALANSPRGEHNWHECFTENFTAYMAGAVRQVDPIFISFFDDQFPSLNFGQTNKKGLKLKDDSYLREHNVGRDEKGRFVRAGESDVPEGYIPTKDGVVVDRALNDFKTVEEARKWMAENVVEVPKGIAPEEYIELPEDIETMNAYLRPIRNLYRHNPDMEKIGNWQLEMLAGGNLGQFNYPTNRPGRWEPGEYAGTISLRPRLETRKQYPLDILRHSIVETDMLKTGLEFNLKRLVDRGEGESEEAIGLINRIKYYEKSIAKRKVQFGKRELKAEQIPVSHMMTETQAGGCTLHEMGHAWNLQHWKQVKDHFGYEFIKGLVTAEMMDYRVTQYSETEWLESFAENWTFYHSGLHKRMHKKFVEFFDEQFPTINFGQTNPKGRRNKK